MDPIQHSFCNSILRRPEGMSEEECRDLPILRSKEGVASFWLPDPIEIEGLQAGQPIILQFAAHTHPPVSVGVLSIPDDPKENGGKVQEKSGVYLIAEERARQITAEGWTAAHDDEHDSCELNIAADCYLTTAHLQAVGGCGPEDCQDHWPFDGSWWKPSPDPIRNLVKAGALIAAEIDRLQRVENGGQA